VQIGAQLKFRKRKFSPDKREESESTQVAHDLIKRRSGRWWMLYERSAESSHLLKRNILVIRIEISNNNQVNSRWLCMGSI
jgi:hypothetical protein